METCYRHPKSKVTNGNYVFLSSTNGFQLRLSMAAGMRGKLFSHYKRTRIGVVTLQRETEAPGKTAAFQAGRRGVGVRGGRKAGWLVEMAWLAAGCARKAGGTASG